MEKSKKESLEEQAVAELLKEAARGRERAKTLGPTGWRKQNAGTNKEFLRRTLLGTLQKQRRDEKQKQVANESKDVGSSSVQRKVRKKTSPSKNDSYSKEQRDREKKRHRKEEDEIKKPKRKKW